MRVAKLSPEPIEQLAQIAERELGKHEIGTTNEGPDILKYQAATTLGLPGRGEGYPWCAAFVSWCAQQMWKSCAEMLSGSPPRTAGAFALLDWARQQGHQIITPAECEVDKLWPRRGDIVVYNFSHCGIVRAVNAKERNFTAVEGNSNTDGSRDGTSVVSHGRTFSQVRGFVRLTLKGIPA